MLNKYKCKTVALLVIVIFTAVFNGLHVSAGSPAESSDSRIISALIYVDKIEDGITKTVIVQSREDIRKFPAKIIVQVYLSTANAAEVSDGRIHLFKLEPYQPESDIAYMESLAFAEAQGVSGEYSLTFEIALDTSLSNGEIYKKYVVGIQKNGVYVPITNSSYISEINRLSNVDDVPPKAISKKGLEVQMYGDVKLLGVSHATVNIFINDFMSAERGSSTEEYRYKNESFFFDLEKISQYDKQIKYLTNEGVIVTARLLLSAENSGTADGTQRTPVQILMHPNVQSGSNALFFGINMVDPEGIKYFCALMSYIADRYVKEDIGYGRITNFILGYEIGQSALYNDCGSLNMEEYAVNYMTALHIMDIALRSRFGGARVYIPFGNKFAVQNLPSGEYANKDLIGLICEYSLKEGNFPWNVAFHAYNYDKSTAAFWNEKEPVFDYSTPVITMKNIEVLSEYLNVEMKDYLAGETRKIILSAQGFTSKSNSKNDMLLQAAAYAYAYLKISYLPDIEAFIYHRHVDSTKEDQAYGLWTAVEGASPSVPGVKKDIYNIFKFVNTNKSAEVTEFALGIIGISSWSDVIKNYDSNDVVDLHITEEVNITPEKDISTKSIVRFNAINLSGFSGGSGINSISVMDYKNDGSAFDGKKLIAAGINIALIGNYSGIQKNYSSEEILDLSNAQYIGVKMRVDTSLETIASIPFSLILQGEEFDENGEISYGIMEGAAIVTPNQDSTIYFKLENYKFKSNVTGVTIMINPHSGIIEPSQLSNAALAEDSDFYMNIFEIVYVPYKKSSIIWIIVKTLLILLGVCILAFGVLVLRAQIIRYNRRKRRVARYPSERHSDNAVGYIQRRNKAAKKTWIQRMFNKNKKR